MEPIAIVTAFLAILYLVGRGPLVFAPTATVAYYRRMLSAPGRIRIFGGMLMMLAAALIVTARQARDFQGEITIVIEAIGWLAAAAAVWAAVFPGSLQRLTNSFWDAVSDPAQRRAIGVLNIALGLFLGWVAFFVL